MAKQKIPKEYKRIYERSTCQRCNQPVTEKRMINCRDRRFFPVCAECEKWLLPKYKEALKKLQEKGMRLM